MSSTVSLGQLRQNVKNRMRELHAIHSQIEDSRTRRCEIENQISSEVRKYITTSFRRPEDYSRELDQYRASGEAWARLERFKALAEKKRQELTASDAKLQEERKGAQASKYEALEKYGQAQCKCFCSIIRRRLPRELRDMIFDCLIESEEDWWKILDLRVDIHILGMEALTRSLETRFPYAIFYQASYMGAEIRDEIVARWRWKYEGTWVKID